MRLDRDTSSDGEPGGQADDDIAVARATASNESADEREQVDHEQETGGSDADGESSPAQRLREHEDGEAAQVEGVAAATNERPDVAVYPSEEELRAFAELGEARYAELMAKGELSYTRISTIGTEATDAPVAEAVDGGTDQVETAHDKEAQSDVDKARLDGERDYVVDDPAIPGRTITDIDHIENGILWEEKSATNAGDIDRWVAKHIDKKFASYVDARQYVSGYEQAPIGFRFISPGVDASFRSTVESAVERLRVAHPGEQILLEWSE